MGVHEGRKNGGTSLAYDAAGNNLHSGLGNFGNYQTTEYDVANRPLKTISRYRERWGPQTFWTYENETTQVYDGDGHPLKIVETQRRISPLPAFEVELDTKYQVWSTVLNNTLTELTAAGDKFETKVFAGGAIVARQNGSASTGNVSWIHADPVTGSTQSVNKDGAGFDYLRTEIEPLGQEVLTVKPEADFPAGTTASSFSASEPEWLCKYENKDFWQMAASCQRSQLENFGLFYISASEAGNPAKITDKSGPSTPTELTPTAKQRNAGSEGGAVPPSSVPGKGEPPTLRPAPSKSDREARKAAAQADPFVFDEGGSDVFSTIFSMSRIREELDTQSIVDSTVLVTGKGGEVESSTTIGRIKQQIRRLVTDVNCRKAFIDGGFGDPRRFLLDSVNNKASGESNSFSYTIVSAFALRDSSIASQLGVPEEARRILLNRTSAASTDVGLGLTVVRNSIFTDSHSIEYAITHEYFHAIGYPGWYRFGSLQALAGYHDLNYLGNKYNRVTDNCTK